MTTNDQHAETPPADTPPVDTILADTMPADKQRRDILRIASWNIRKAVGLDWRRDPARVMRVIDRLDADIVLLQETDKRPSERPGERPSALPPELLRSAGWQRVMLDGETGSIGYEGNAILFKDPVDVAAVRTLDLPGLESRGAVLADMVVAPSLQPRRAEAAPSPRFSFSLAAVHLSLLPHDRIRQMTQVFDAVAQAGRPTIIGGDLNEWRGRTRLLPAAPHWTEISPGRTFHAALPVLRLDRFGVSPEITVVGQGVLPQRELDRASDHLPLWIDVALSDTPSRVAASGP